MTPFLNRSTNEKHCHQSNSVCESIVSPPLEQDRQRHKTRNSFEPAMQTTQRFSTWIYSWYVHLTQSNEQVVQCGKCWPSLRDYGSSNPRGDNRKEVLAVLTSNRKDVCRIQGQVNRKKPQEVAGLRTQKEDLVHALFLGCTVKQGRRQMFETRGRLRGKVRDAYHLGYKSKILVSPSEDDKKSPFSAVKVSFRVHSKK